MFRWLIVPLLALLLGRVASAAGPTPFGERIPPVSFADLERFPDAATTQSRILELLETRQWLDRQMAIFPSQASEWWPARQETVFALEAWRVLRDAQSWAWTANWPESRLTALQVLRQQIGLRAYYEGKMP